MSNPNQNFGSPYDQQQSMQSQYPSQSADYLSLDLGGPSGSRGPFGNRHQQKRWHRGLGRFSSTPMHKQKNGGDHHDSRGGGDSAEVNTENKSVPYFYSNPVASQLQQQQTNRSYNYFRRGSNNANRSMFARNRRYHQNPGSYQQKLEQPMTKEEVFAAYFHPSMLENPWQDLMERCTAIRRSVISSEQIEDFDEDMSSDDDNPFTAFSTNLT